MNRNHSTIILVLVLFAGINAFAQTRSTSSATTTSTGTTASGSKVDKTLDNTNKTIDNTTYTADKAKKTLSDFTGMFKSKAPNEASIVIPGIEFEDENLEKLAAAIKDHKDVKKASVEYTDGTATINVVLKAKAGTDFWSELPKEMKELFKMKSKKDNNILVAYKNSTGGNISAEMADNRIENSEPMRAVSTTTTRNNGLQPGSTKKSTPAEGSVFIQFVKDGNVEEMMNASVAIQTQLGALGSGVSMTFMDVTTGQIANLTLTGGGKEIHTGKYSFTMNKGVKTPSDKMATTSMAIFAYQPSNSARPEESAMASTANTQGVEANVVTGFIEITNIDISGKGIVEGKFQFDVNAWKKPHGEEMPACSIKEGAFRAMIRK